MSGITDTGFSPATLQQIKDAIEADLAARFGVPLNFSSSGVLGTIDGIVSARLQEIWDVMAAVYASQSPDQAVGAALDNICALCPGITRIPAAKTTIPADLTLNAHTTVPSGSLVHPSGIDDWQFATTADVENDTDDPAIIETVLEATDYGARYFNETELIIDTPVSGWIAAEVTSAGAVVDQGLDEETDYALRLRREESLGATGGANSDAIRARVLNSDTDDIYDVAVYFNDTNNVVNGMLPHSVRVVVWDGNEHDADEDAIAKAIFDTVAAGIYTNGAQEVELEDARGYLQTVRYDFADPTDIYVHYDSPTSTVTDNAPVDWVTQVNNKLLELVAAEQEIGEDLIFQQLLTGVMAAFGVGLPVSEDLPQGGWLVDLDAFGISTYAGGYSSANITIADGYVAQLTANHIDDGAP